MNVVVVAQPWGEWLAREGDGPALSATVADAWVATAPTVTVDARDVPDGGPSSAEMLVADPMRVGRVGGVRAYRDGTGVVLAPETGSRFNTQHLAAGLLGLATQPHQGRTHVLIPLGDEPPAGDATDLWGAGRDQVARALSPLDMTVLVTQHRPLLGFSGMSAALREGREHDLAMAAAAQAQESRWSDIAHDVDRAVGRDLMGTRLSEQPGTGAAAGLAYCLAAVGARLVPAAPALLDICGVREALQQADVAVVVVQELSVFECDHGLARAVTDVMAHRARPSIVMAERVGVGKRDIMAAGIAGAYDGVGTREQTRTATRRVAQTWTPPRDGGW